jgi:hypothetical protein
MQNINFVNDQVTKLTDACRNLGLQSLGNCLAWWIVNLHDNQLFIQHWIEVACDLVCTSCPRLQVPVIIIIIIIIVIIVIVIVVVVFIVELFLIIQTCI